MRALWPQLVGLRTGGARLRFRMDGAFFRQDVLRWLQGRGVGYAIKVPFYRWLDLQRYIRNSPTWVPVAPGVTGFAVPGADFTGQERWTEIPGALRRQDTGDFLPARQS